MNCYRVCLWIAHTGTVADYYCELKTNAVLAVNDAIALVMRMFHCNIINFATVEIVTGSGVEVHQRSRSALTGDMNLTISYAYL